MNGFKRNTFLLIHMTTKKKMYSSHLPVKEVFLRKRKCPKGGSGSHQCIRAPMYVFNKIESSATELGFQVQRGIARVIASIHDYVHLCSSSSPSSVLTLIGLLG
ncbi:hypothetical protein GUJ93_ZPchr0001g32650 [Zizania palustris]|uniref:Uncharacterized protein n=2 Tax=Zizania palustris TaxID=103762 RepID=A0A8J5RFP0_ZIZPA|nr:hypothetical protein GUJ93_ZPchr0001g32650 [Zizania palustris]